MRLATALLVAGVFAAVLAMTFPTDAIVRWAIARAAPGLTGMLAFRQARLRLAGLRLDGVAFRDPGGAIAVDADWVTLRPSLAGLLQNDHAGWPWFARAGACAGTVDARAERDPTGNVLTFAWDEIDVARCPALPLAAHGFSGVAAGHARMAGGRVAGDLGLRAVTWTNVLPGLRVLRADTASSRWVFADGRVALTGIALDGPDLEARGGGTVRVGDGAGAPELDLILTLAPGRDAPPALRNFIAHLPGGAPESPERRVAVTGPALAPQIVAAP